ncbi:MAG: DUF262 domain-containing protein [Microcoleaceae cyanobacterium]
MAKKVNLDALIPREDFEIQESPGVGKKIETISIENIQADAFFYVNIRKPDFQRETNEWDSQKICEFITSFIEGDLIPAIILWRSPSGYLFIIDGSHRLSSLSAWVNDDYGDGQTSKLFYDGSITEEQENIAQTTRKLVEKNIGSYENFRLAQRDPSKVSENVRKYAKNLAALAIQLQWVEGDASKAESSFFKINQQAAPIDKTELKLLKSRKKPNSIAARAIIRSGKGHKYWSSFSNEIQNQIQQIATEIHQMLFEPKLQTPIKTMDVPLAGKLSSRQALALVLDFVNIVNNIDFNDKNISDDETGLETLKFIKEVQKIAYRLNSNYPSSLGLHPIVYFYSKEGRYRTVSFLAVVDFVMKLINTQKINNFIEVRNQFETLLIENDYLIKQIYEKHRSTQKSYKPLSDFFLQIIITLKENQDIFSAINSVASRDNFKYLNIRKEILPKNSSTSKNKFSSNQKSEIYIKEALNKTPRCKICHGFLHSSSISIDHIKRKADGGLATIDNGQLTHPYCNTTFKN